MSNPNEFQTKWPEMNKALEIVGPLTRGKIALIGGVTHSYKTGLLTDLFYQHCTGKVAIPVSSQRTPKILYITADESDSSLVERLIDHACIQENLPRPTEEESLSHESIEFLFQTLSGQGYKAEIFALPPDHQPTVDNLLSIINERITDDSEVHAVYIDGLDRLNQEPTTDHVTEMQALKTFAAKENILMIGTHQLSLAALVGKREGIAGADVVKDAYVNSYWINGDEQIANLVDVEIFVDLRMDVPTLDVLCGSHKQNVESMILSVNID